MCMLDKEIETFTKKEAAFKKEHLGEWVIIKDDKIIGFFENFQAAADKVFSDFETTPVLLRQIGFEPKSYPNVEFATV